LFNWFGKSDLPVATIFAQACFARSGMISGVGLAMANIIGSGFIVFTISGVSIHGADTHMKISLQAIASANQPLIQDFDSGSSMHEVLVIFVSICFVGFSHSLHLNIVHLESTITTSLIPYLSISFAIATHAAQTQFMSTFIFSFFFLVIFREFIIQASATIAVPC
jgi:hypothetical protein